MASGAAADSIALTWKAPADPSITGYDVYEHVRHVVYGGKGGSRSYYTDTLLDTNLPATSVVVPGLATGTFHAYFVTSVNATGQSIASALATGETWIAPTLNDGPNIFLLSVGALGPGPWPRRPA